MVGKIPWRRERLPNPVFWHGDFWPEVFWPGLDMEVAKSWTGLGMLLKFHFSNIGKMQIKTIRCYYIPMEWLK